MKKKSEAAADDGFDGKVLAEIKEENGDYAEFNGNDSGLL